MLLAVHVYTPPSSTCSDVTTSRLPVTSARDDVTGRRPAPRDHVITGVGVPTTSSHDTFKVSPGLCTSRLDLVESRNLGAAVPEINIQTTSRDLKTSILDPQNIKVHSFEYVPQEIFLQTQTFYGIYYISSLKTLCSWAWRGMHRDLDLWFF